MMMVSPEALAMRQTVSFAKDEGFTGIILNSNCMFVVKRVVKEIEDCSFCGPIIQEASEGVHYGFVLTCEPKPK
jgi:hypothetical protein